MIRHYWSTLTTSRKYLENSAKKLHHSTAQVIFQFFVINTNKFCLHIFPANYTMEEMCGIFTPQQDQNILYTIGQLVSSSQLLDLTTNQKPYTDTGMLVPRH